MFSAHKISLQIFPIHSWLYLQWLNLWVWKAACIPKYLWREILLGISPFLENQAGKIQKYTFVVVISIVRITRRNILKRFQKYWRKILTPRGLYSCEDKAAHIRTERSGQYQLPQQLAAQERLDCIIFSKNGSCITKCACNVAWNVAWLH